MVRPIRETPVLKGEDAFRSAFWSLVRQELRDAKAGGGTHEQGAAVLFPNILAFQ